MPKAATHQDEAGPPDPAPVSAARERTPEELAQLAALSIGAQVILDFNGAGSIGARGGAGESIEENTIARNAHLAALGYDPNGPTGPPTVPDPGAAVQSADQVHGSATRMSSLAAGIITGDPGSPGFPVAPVNVDVPHVQQEGANLTCTMGNWQGEPTSYAYAWTVDGATAGSDAATYAVQPEDVGKAGVCTVTATNAAGSTVAPASVPLTITDPAARNRRSDHGK